MAEDDLRLGRLLVQSGLLREEVLRAVIEERERMKQTGPTVPRLGEMLVARGLVTAAQMKVALTEPRQATMAEPPQEVYLCVPCRLRFTAAKKVSPSTPCPKCGGKLMLADAPSMPSPLRAPEAAARPEESATRHEEFLTTEIHRPVVTARTVEEVKKDPSRRLGKVVLLDELGRGGMGIVYRAWQEDLRRVVAVKVAADADDKSLAARFLREARLAAKLRHPNIVAVHDIYEAQERTFFTMDYIAGESLDAWFKRDPGVRKVLEVIRTVALALQYAHDQGIIHRDIKPQNVLMSADGTPFLTDFGLAREVLSSTNLTQSHGVLGTPRYMSPEQAKGQNALVDARADVYSLGGVLYEGLVGVPPVGTGDIFSMYESIVEAIPPAPSVRVKGIPRDVDTICLKCLEKSPDKRYPTAKALAEDIERFLRGDAIQARPTGRLEKMIRRVRRRWLPLSASAAAVALLVVGVLWWRSRSHVVAEDAGWKAVLARVEEDCKVPDYGKALAEVAQFPASTKEAKAAVETERQVILKIAEDEFDAIDKEAQELARTGQLSDAGDSHYIEVRTWGVEGLARRAEERIEGIKRTIEEKNLELSRFNLSHLQRDVCNLCGAGKWDEAWNSIALGGRALATQSEVHDLAEVVGAARKASQKAPTDAPKMDLFEAARKGGARKEAIDALAGAVAADVSWTKTLFHVGATSLAGLPCWSYKYNNSRHLLDWGTAPLDLDGARVPWGMGVSSIQGFVQNGEARFAACLEGDRHISANVYPHWDQKGGKKACFGLMLGGYTWYVRDGEDNNVLCSPSGKKLCAVPAMTLYPDGEMYVQLVIARGKIWAKVHNGVRFCMDLPEPPVPSRPGFFARKDTSLRFGTVEMAGAPVEKWRKEYAEEQATLARLGKDAKPQPAVKLTDGKGYGAFSHGGAWDVSEGALKAAAVPADDPPWLRCDGKENFRLRIKYGNPLDSEADPVLDAQVAVETGRPGGAARFPLPSGTAHRDCSLEVVAIGSAIRCVANGITVVEPEAIEGKGAPSITLTVRRGTLRITEATLEEIRAPR